MVLPCVVDFVVGDGEGEGHGLFETAAGGREGERKRQVGCASVGVVAHHEQGYKHDAGEKEFHGLGLGWVRVLRARLGRGGLYGSRAGWQRRAWLGRGWGVAGGAHGPKGNARQGEGVPKGVMDARGSERATRDERGGVFGIGNEVGNNKQK